jgi:hypothetical protein
MIRPILFLLILIAYSLPVSAQNNSSPKKNSVELNLIWPFIPKIYQLKYGREIFELQNGMKGEFISSINYRPRTFSEHEGDKSMFALAVGYRHYWWKGFNSEIAIYPEFISIENNVVDGNDYTDFYIVPEFYCGYKGKLGNKGLFYNIQLGTGVIIFPDESYPRTEDIGIFFNGNLTIGYLF